MDDYIIVTATVFNAVSIVVHLMIGMKLTEFTRRKARTDYVIMGFALTALEDALRRTDDTSTRAGIERSIEHNLKIQPRLLAVAISSGMLATWKAQKELEKASVL